MSTVWPFVTHEKDGTAVKPNTLNLQLLLINFFFSLHFLIGCVNFCTVMTLLIPEIFLFSWAKSVDFQTYVMSD